MRFRYNSLLLYTVGYKFKNTQEKVNHLRYTDDIKLFAKKEKELETLIQAIRLCSQDVGMEFSLRMYKLQMKSGKRQITEEIELLNYERIKTLGEK